MSDAPYSNRELDAKFSGIHEKLEDNKTLLVGKLDSIDEKVTYTNGKVKKTIVARVLLFGIVIGQG
jgi:tetrahydromethanopterin S-methyltransferase subunit G